MPIYYFLIFLIVLAGCNPRIQETDKQSVTVSIRPQKFLVEKIAGDHFIVNILVPDGNGPETYEPTARQIQEVSRSRVYFITGLLDFERSWVPKLSENYPDLKVVDISKGTEIISGTDHSHHNHESHDQHNSDEDAELDEAHSEHDQSGIDPHIWLSLKSLKKQSFLILDELIKLKPDLAKEFTINHQSLVAHIDSLDNVFLNRFLSNGSNVSFMIYHPSLSYFARDYGITQIPIELEGKEPSPAYMRQLIDMASSRDIKVILYSEQFDKRSAETLAKQLGIDLFSFDPLAEKVDGNLISITDVILKSTAE